MPGSHTISISLEEALGFIETSAAAADFRGRDNAERFEDWDEQFADTLIAESQFDDGSIHHVRSQLEALVLLKVLTAEGFTSHLLRDVDSDGVNSAMFAVLTTRPLY